MLNMLAEVAGTPPAQTAGIVAAILAAVEGLKCAGRKVQKRNGNGHDRCSDRLGVVEVDQASCSERVAVVETEQANFKEWLQRIEKMLDEALKK